MTDLVDKPLNFVLFCLLDYLPFEPALSMKHDFCVLSSNISA